jgi:hypothetical protein
MVCEVRAGFVSMLTTTTAGDLFHLVEPPPVWHNGATVVDRRVRAIYRVCTSEFIVDSAEPLVPGFVFR